MVGAMRRWPLFGTMLYETLLFRGQTETLGSKLSNIARLVVGAHCSRRLMVAEVENAFPVPLKIAFRRYGGPYALSDKVRTHV